MSCIKETVLKNTTLLNSIKSQPFPTCFPKPNRMLPKLALASSLALLIPMFAQAATIEFAGMEVDFASESQDGTATQIALDIVGNNPDYGGACTIEADLQQFTIAEFNNATLGADYSLSSQTVSIVLPEVSVGSQTVMVNINDDFIAEPEERIGLQLLNPRITSGTCTAQLGATATTELRILADEITQSNQTINITPPTVTRVMEDQDGEGAQIDFQVTLDNPNAGGPCTITAEVQHITTGGELDDATLEEDFTLSSSTVTFNILDPTESPTQLSQTVSIFLIDDQITEPTENLTLQLSNSDANNYQGEVQCNVVDGTTVSFNLAIDDGLSTEKQSIALEGSPGQTVTDSFTVSGDWQSVSANIDNNQGRIDVERLDQAEPEWRISYSFDIPANAVIGSNLQDLITVTGNNELIPEPTISPLANPSGIPVTINVVSGLSAKPASAAGSAWQELCESTQDPELQEQCAKTGDIETGYQLNNQQLNDVLPEEYAAMGTGSIDMAQGQIKTIFYQQQARRQGVKGVDLNRLSMTLDGQLIPIGQLMDALLDEATGGAAGDTNSGRWSGFISGRVSGGKKSASDNDDGYDFDIAGLTAGADYLFSPQAFIGGALGYAAMDSNFGGSGGDLDISATTLTLYTSYFTKSNLYFDFSATYGQNGYDFNRNITSFSTQTQGSTDGSQLMLSLNGGWDFNAKSWLLSPYLRIDYIDTAIDAFEENGGSGLALQVDEQNIQSTTSALGGRFSYAASMKWGVLIPMAHLEWIHEYNDDDRAIIAQFANHTSSSFSTPVDEVDQDYLNIGVGLSANWPGGHVLYLNYETIAEQKNISNHILHLGGRMEF